MTFKDQIKDTERSISSIRLKFDIAKTVVIIKVHSKITSLATHCADVSLPGRCLPKWRPPLKMRPWAGFYFLFLFFLAITSKLVIPPWGRFYGDCRQMLDWYHDKLLKRRQIILGYDIA